MIEPWPTNIVCLEHNEWGAGFKPGPSWLRKPLRASRSAPPVLDAGPIFGALPWPGPGVRLRALPPTLQLVLKNRELLLQFRTRVENLLVILLKRGLFRATELDNVHTFVLRKGDVNSEKFLINPWHTEAPRASLNILKRLNSLYLIIFF